VARQTASSMTRQPQIAGSPGPAARCPTRDSKILSESKPPKPSTPSRLPCPPRVATRLSTPDESPGRYSPTGPGNVNRPNADTARRQCWQQTRTVSQHSNLRLGAHTRGRARPRSARCRGLAKVSYTEWDPTCRAVAASFAGADGAAHALSRMVPRRWLQRLRSSPFRGVWRQLSHRTCPASGCSPLTFPGCPSR